MQCSSALDTLKKIHLNLWDWTGVVEHELTDSNPVLCSCAWLVVFESNDGIHTASSQAANNPSAAWQCCSPSGLLITFLILQ